MPVSDLYFPHNIHTSMLCIGDIHITQRHSGAILTAIREHIARFPGEKSIIFVGDYVYHFSYQRDVLLRFFQLCLELIGA